MSKQQKLPVKITEYSQDDDEERKVANESAPANELGATNKQPVVIERKKAQIVQLMTMQQNGSASVNQFQMVIPVKQKKRKQQHSNEKEEGPSQGQPKQVDNGVKDDSVLKVNKMLNNGKHVKHLNNKSIDFLPVL